MVYNRIKVTKSKNQSQSVEDDCSKGSSSLYNSTVGSTMSSSHFSSSCLDDQQTNEQPPGHPSGSASKEKGKQRHCIDINLPFSSPPSSLTWKKLFMSTATASFVLICVGFSPFVMLNRSSNATASNPSLGLVQQAPLTAANDEKRRELSHSSSLFSFFDRKPASTNTFPSNTDPRLSIYFNNTIPKPKPDYSTGSFANCTHKMKTSTNPANYKPKSNHPDAGKVLISCREIHFRAPLSQIEKGGIPIVVGVLSGAGGKGPIHRDSIRSTWARDRPGVYFIVAGPWEDIEKEYNERRDLIWIDEEEIYEGEESVLPFKTETFLYIMNKYTLPGKAGFEYLFKTDDDSYVDLTKLEEEIGGKKDVHYWGCCTDVHYRPLRHPSRKWRITFDLYPEKFYPLYCQGAGFAVSRRMAQCITSEENINNFRYNPFEDVSIGLLAERCGYPHTSDCKKIRQYRTKDSGELKQLKGQKMEQIHFLPKATMEGRILQHRVKTHMDMYAHYKCVQDGC